ncbi:MAG: penicillin-binding protein 2 [Patescibacteria group bacterium]|jgi:cell division protein FtsI/penicillin-binding protein 2
MIKKFFKNRFHYSSHKIKKAPAAADRLKVLCAIFFIVGGIIIMRLAYVQVWQHNFYAALASQNHDLYKDLFPNRGEIYVRDPLSAESTYKIAANQDLAVVYANPWLIENSEQAVKDLAPLLGMSQDELNKKLEPKMLDNDRKDTYEVLKRRVSDYEKKAIEDLKIEGVDFTSEAWRYYPNAEYTAHLTGFLGVKDDARVGQYGLEGYFEDELKGTPGYLLSEKDASGRFLAIGDKITEEAQDGDDLYLTIDKNIQFYACDKLQQAVEKHGAKQGTVIIMQPTTGAILALCNFPSFDPNNYSDVESVSVFMDSAVSDQYESGSVFKSFSLGAAIDMGKITPYSTYEDKGYVKIANYTIRNSDTAEKGAHGVVDMKYVLAKSLNTGSIYAVQQIGNEAWYQYVKNLGFGEETGIELAGENSGNISSLEQLKDIYSATSSYGQGITVTPIQLITAYNTLANGGKLMKPYIIAEKVKANGYKEVTEPTVVRQVFSQQTASTISAMLVNVVDNGHSYMAAIPGYYIGGKTGTAQIALEDGSGYSGSRHKDTFVGYAPISNPQFIMLVKMDEPQDVSWAEGSVAPIWHDIAEYILDYYQIPPDRE